MNFNWLCMLYFLCHIGISNAVNGTKLIENGIGNLLISVKLCFRIGNIANSFQKFRKPKCPILLLALSPLVSGIWKCSGNFILLQICWFDFQYDSFKAYLQLLLYSALKLRIRPVYIFYMFEEGNKEFLILSDVYPKFYGIMFFSQI